MINKILPLLMLSALSGAAQTPSVTSFFPIQAKTGDTIVINGSNFGTNIASNRVFFGKIQGQIITANANSIAVVVPKGPKKDFISVQNITTNKQGQSNAYFHQIFTPSNGSLQVGDLGPVQLREFISSATGYSGLASPVLADFDNDGKLDLLIPKHQNRFLGAFWEVYRNTHQAGNPLSTSLFDLSFSQQTMNQNGITSALGGQLDQFIVKDVNNDGKLDIICGGNYNINQQDSMMSLNQSTTGNISFSTPINYHSFTTNPQFNLAAIEDIDGDGLPDFIGHRLSILKNTSTTAGGFSLSPVSVNTGGTVPSNYGANSSEFIDLDGDGKIDIIGFLANELIFYRNTSTIGNFSFATPVIFPLVPPTAANYQIRGITLGDLDNDGKPDVVVGSQLMTTNAYTNVTIILRNTGTAGNLSFAPQINLPSVTAVYSGGTFSQPSLKDLNGDGKLDIITRTDATVGGINFYANQYNGTGALQVSSFALPFRIDMQYPRGYDFGDLDGDGLPDIAGVRGHINGSHMIFLIRNIPMPLVNPNPALTCAHNDIDLSVFPSATVPTPTAFAWQVSTGTGVPFTAVIDGAQYSGSSQSTLTIIGPNNSMDGYRYRCAVSGQMGFSFSTEAVLQIQQLTSPIITFNNPVLSVPNLYTSYQWYLNGNAIPGANMPSHTATSIGAYHVVVQEEKDGCFGESAIYNVDQITSIKDLSQNKWGIQIYPNPAQDILYFENENKIAVQYTISNMLGQKVTKGNLNQESGQIAISALAKGVYNIVLQNDEEQFNLKFVKN